MANPSTDNMSHAISEDNHGPLITIPIYLSLIGTFMFSLIRLNIRWPWGKLFGFDDACALVASVLGIAQGILVLYAVRLGLGTHRDSLRHDQIGQIANFIYASNIVIGLSMGFSRIAVSTLLMRLSVTAMQIRISNAITAIVVCWMGGVTIAVSILSPVMDIWQKDPSKGVILTRLWTGVSVTGFLIEALLLAFPVALVWSLQMPNKLKWVVILGFLCRTPVVVLGILRLTALYSAISEGVDFTWNSVGVFIYAELEMYYSIFAATIPCMHVFLRAFDTGFLATSAAQVDRTAAATQGSNSYPLSGLKSTTEQDTVPSNHAEEQGMHQNLTEDTTSARVDHRSSAIETVSLSSDGSDAIIIRKTVRIDWENMRNPES